VTIREAKDILLLYRPGRGEEGDPQVVEALDLARREPELQEWLRQSSAFHETVTSQLKSLPVPRDLKADILLGPKIVRGPAHWWTRTVPIAAAASIILCATIAFIWTNSKAPSDFARFRSRMVGIVLREYRMDIVTNDMPQVRSYLAARSAPSDYIVPPKLDSLSLTGAGVLHWQGKPVSMVCFDRGAKDMVFLFVSDRKNVGDAPVSAAQMAPVKGLATAAWTMGDKVYMLAASGDEEALRSYLP